MTWRERLDRARESCRFTPEDVVEANDWRKCPVGEHTPYSTEPAASFGIIPHDSESCRLGFSFEKAVRHNKVAVAEDLYLKIQAFFEHPEAGKKE